MRKRRSLHVVLDTSILIHAIDEGVDLFESLEDAVVEPLVICIPTAVLEELKRLSGSDEFSKRRKALLALKYIEKRRRNIKVLKSPKTKPVDDVVLEEASRLMGAVATSDRGLRIKAVKKGLRVFLLRQGKRKVVEYLGP